MVQTELTLDDLEQMPDDAMHRELVHGELIELPPPEAEHVDVAHNIYDSLSPFVRRRSLGKVYIEAGYKVTVDKRSLFGAPELAVEVVSPSERPKHIPAKREVLFRMERELADGETLSSPLFEGWSMPVSGLFA